MNNDSNNKQDSSRTYAGVSTSAGAVAGGAAAVCGVSAGAASGTAGAAALTSGLACVGAAVGGGMFAGLCTVAVAPIAGGAVGYGVYRLYKYLARKKK